MIHVALNDRQLWREFDSQCNEMIITKIGRNLFPILEYAFKGLQDHLDYQIGVTMHLTSCQKLKFTAGKWDPLDVLEEVFVPNEVFLNKPKSGRELMQRGLKLDKLKLTNTKDALAKNNQMIRVQSMRQYIPILNVYELLPGTSPRLVGKFEFQETKFIAVTAYQSEKVKNLKVSRNKFAQGFREGIRAASATKRPTSTTSSTSPDSTLSMTSSDGSPGNMKRMKEDCGPDGGGGGGYHPISSGVVGPGTSSGFPVYQDYQFTPDWNNYYSQTTATQNFQNFQNFQPTDQLSLNPFGVPTYDYSNPYQWGTQ